MQENHLKEINELTTQINEHSKINIELKNKIEEHNTTIIDNHEFADKNLTRLTEDVFEDGNDIKTLLNKQKSTNKKTKTNFKLLESILPLTDPENLVIFLGHITTKTKSKNTLEENITIINKIAK